MATAEGTSRFLRLAVEKGLLHAGNVRPMAGSSLSCAAVGFGAYRIGGGPAEARHRAALRAAIRGGVNLLDTSTHYSAMAGHSTAAGGLLQPPTGGWHGASERLIGEVLAEAVEAQEATRDGLVLCTKVGHVARDAERPAGSVAVGTAEDDCHSIAPDFLEEEVRGSCERLRTAPDFVLLHNPEYLLSQRLKESVPIGDAWEEMHEQLVQAFQRLEGLCDEGLIGTGYGVSSNFLSCYFSTTGRSNVYEALVLERVVDAAREAAKKAGREASAHRFRVAQMPLNAVESGAVLGRGAVVPEAATPACSTAAELGVALVGNRPLNALPIPGLSAGDWGRQAGHLQLKEKKPMGATEQLLRRAMCEKLFDEQPSPLPPMQQLAVRLSASAPGVAACLIGARQERYVEDVAAVLREAPFEPQRVASAMAAVRSCFEELGCDRRGLW
eukprot:TRINITY_DN92362_c0_g1_i1.p1 TRINITY_DN92362_c0_g1~~TRINITY_DN92362_c0_g1_i1.p1  ORF type:complete len:442 (+),score=117.61 TRINITY_DN92362_c0_g1_i1:74-1399(+)